MNRIATIVTALALFGDIGFAAEAPLDAIGLGLDKLKWGMTLTEVKTLYPSMETQGGAVPLLANYLYAGCNFDVFPEFTSGKLDTVIAETSENALPCYQKIKQELLGRYGQPNPEKSLRNGTRLEWTGRVTNIWYIGDSEFLHIAFEQAEGSPHHVIYDPTP